MIDCVGDESSESEVIAEFNDTATQVNRSRQAVIQDNSVVHNEMESESISTAPRPKLRAEPRIFLFGGILLQAWGAVGVAGIGMSKAF